METLRLAIKKVSRDFIRFIFSFLLDYADALKVKGRVRRYLVRRAIGADKILHVNREDAPYMGAKVWVEFKAVCEQCDVSWTGVARKGTPADALQCPRCGNFTGKAV